MLPLPNLRGSRMARADTIIAYSLPLANNAMHSPTSIRWQGMRKTVRYAGFFSTLKSIWDWFYCPLYGVAGCPFWRGYERTELYDKTIGTIEFVRYNAVSVVEGCPLSRVPLYITCSSSFVSERIAICYATLFKLCFKARRVECTIGASFFEA